jgi:hypothetical protein
MSSVNRYYAGPVVDQFEIPMASSLVDGIVPSTLCATGDPSARW